MMLQCTIPVYMVRMLQKHKLLGKTDTEKLNWLQVKIDMAFQKIWLIAKPNPDFPTFCIQNLNLNFRVCVID